MRPHHFSVPFVAAQRWRRTLPPAPSAPVFSPTAVYDFDGNTSVRFTGARAAATPTEYTISAWVRPSQVAANAAVVIRSDGGPVSSWSHAIHQYTTGWAAYTYDGGFRTANGFSLPAMNRWQHVAATAKNGGLQRIYVNGIEENSGAVGTLWTGGNDWWIATNDGAAGKFAGYMADVAIWSKELTAAEVASLATGTRGVPLTVQAGSLILFCPMTDAGDGVTLPGDYLETGGGLTQTRTGAPVGRLSTVAPPDPMPLDTFESYTPGAELNGLSGGAAWVGTFADRFNAFGLNAYDSFEAYTPGANLDGLNGGTGFTSFANWTGPYVSR